MSSLVAGPPEVDIEYPEGPSAPEGDMQVTRHLELLFALRNWYAGRTDIEGAWVCADHNIYYKEGDPTVVVAPDVAVAFGLDIAAVKNQRSYRVEIRAFPRVGPRSPERLEQEHQPRQAG